MLKIGDIVVCKVESYNLKIGGKYKIINFLYDKVDRKFNRNIISIDNNGIDTWYSCHDFITLKENRKLKLFKLEELQK